VHSRTPVAVDTSAASSTALRQAANADGAGKRLPKRLAAWLLSVSLLTAVPALADEYSLDMRDTDIAEFISTIGKLTGKTIIIDPRVKGKVSITSPKSVTREELYEIFLVQLGVNGFSVVDAGDNLLKVIPQQAAKLEGIEVQGGNSARPRTSEKVVTRVVQVRNVDVTALVPVLRPLVDNQSGLIAPYPASNVLLITDREANVRRLLEIIERMDKAGNDDTEVIWLKNASAEEVSETLTKLISERKSGSDGAHSTPVVTADARTNTLLIRADEASRDYFRQIIGQLDSEVRSGNNTRVFYLKYAKAEDVAELLESISGNASGEVKSSVESANAGQEGVRIKPHVATNSIVMSGSPPAIRDLAQLIDRLDIRRAQVMVEAIIAEMSESRAKELGVQWLLGGRSDSGEFGLGGTNFNNLGNGLNSLVDGALNGAGLEGGDTTLPGLLSGVEGLTAGVGRFDNSGLNFAVLLKALQDDIESNILSTPSLVTMDNEEAYILVGSEIPVITGQTIGDNNTNPFQTIERKDIGVKLRITPQINEGGAVQLQIAQEVSSLTGSSSGASDVIFDKREIETAVMVDDGATIVLGGLIDDNTQETNSRVPWLGDLPLVGRLFRSDSTQITRRNLMVFIRPTIIRDRETLTSVSKAKYGFIRNRQLTAENGAVELFPEERPATLPEWTGLGPTLLNVLPPEK